MGVHIAPLLQAYRCRGSDRLGLLHDVAPPPCPPLTARANLLLGGAWVIQRRDLLLLCGAGLMASAGYTMLGLLTPLVALRLGAGPTLVGAVIAAGFLLPLFFSVPMGSWADRWGSRRMARFGFALFGLALLPMVFAPSWTTLIVGYVLANLGHLAYIVGSQALVGDLAEPGSGRETAYGWWTTSVAAGQALGPLIGGLTLDLFGASAGFAAMSLVMAVAVLLTLPMRVRGASAAAGSRIDWRSAQRLVGDRTVAVAMLTSSVALWAVTVQTTFLPLHLELLAVPAATIGALLSLRALVAVVVRPWVPKLVALLGGRERTVVLTLISMSLGLAGIALGNLWVLALFMVLFGVGFGLSQPVSMVMVADRVEPSERGKALGVRLTGNRLAQLLAPVAFALVAERFGLPLFFVVHALWVMLAAYLLVRLTRRGDPPSGRAQA